MRRRLGLPVALLLSFSSLAPAAAQEAAVTSPRPASFQWDATGRSLLGTVSFRDVVDSKIRGKLSRGLPTRILLTGILYRSEARTPIAATFQTCKITWHVWEEMYRVEVTTPALPLPRKHWTPTLSGVLRRCAQADNLLVANAAQVERGVGVFLEATVVINPISEELLKKLKRWVSRPSSAANASPGSAIFSTFTGLFMQRIGEAERQSTFRTVSVVPR